MVNLAVVSFSFMLSVLPQDPHGTRSVHRFGQYIYLFTYLFIYLYSPGSYTKLKQRFRGIWDRLYIAIIHAPGE